MKYSYFLLFFIVFCYSCETTKQYLYATEADYPAVRKANPRAIITIDPRELWPGRVDSLWNAQVDVVEKYRNSPLWDWRDDPPAATGSSSSSSSSSGSSSSSSSGVSSDCTCKGIPLYGNVEVVNAGATFKVRIENSGFANLEVRTTIGSPSRCGEWRFVQGGADFTIEYVIGFEDFTIRFLNY